MLTWKSFAIAGALLAWSGSALAVIATPVVVVADAGPDASGPGCDLDGGVDAGDEAAEADAGDAAADADVDAGCAREDERDVSYVVVTTSPPVSHHDVEQECCGFRIAPRSAHSTAALGGLAIGVALLGRRRRR